MQERIPLIGQPPACPENVELPDDLPHVLQAQREACAAESAQNPKNNAKAEERQAKAQATVEEWHAKARAKVEEQRAKAQASAEANAMVQRLRG